jgi:hypothetical protein
LLTQLTGRVLNRALDVELTAHPGSEKDDPPECRSGNNRNGSTTKTVPADIGAVPVKVPGHDHDVIGLRQFHADGRSSPIRSATVVPEAVHRISIFAHASLRGLSQEREVAADQKERETPAQVPGDLARIGAEDPNRCSDGQHGFDHTGDGRRVLGRAPRRSDGDRQISRTDQYTVHPVHGGYLPCVPDPRESFDLDDQLYLIVRPGEVLSDR